MKQSRLFRLIALLMLPVLCIGLTACGGDDDEPDSKDPIVGTWFEVLETGETDSNNSLTFNSDGTGEERWYDYDEGEKGIERFKWRKIKERVYSLIYDDDAYNYDLSITVIDKNTILVDYGHGDGSCFFQRK